MRQEVTRAHKGWSLDSVMLHNDVTKWAREDINNPPAVSSLMLHLVNYIRLSAFCCINYSVDVTFSGVVAGQRQSLALNFELSEICF